MADSINYTTQFEIEELSIVSKIGYIDISTFFEEIHIFDSIFNPCVSGKILVRDSLGLANKLMFDGTELIKISIGKTKNLSRLEKTFRIYKITERKPVNPNTETYIIHFVSEEYFLSQQQRISKFYKKTYSDIAKNIFEEYLGLKSNKVFVESTLGIRQIIMPFETPFWCLNLCARKAVNQKKSPTFVFYENNVGYHFVSLSSLISKSPITTVNYQPKNVLEEDMSKDFNGARELEVISQFNIDNNIKSGLYGSTFYGIDLTAGKVVKKTANFFDIYSKSLHANKSPNVGIFQNKLSRLNTQMTDSNIVVHFSDALSGKLDYIKKNNPVSINEEDDTYNYMIERRALIQNFMNRRLRVVMPGNFILTSGETVNMMIPKLTEKTINDGDNLDETLSGKYLIAATRHIISFNRHETVMEIITDSTIHNSTYQSSAKQTSLLVANG